MSMLNVVAFTTNLICFQMLGARLMAQAAINKNAPAGDKFLIKFNGVQTTAIVLYVAAGVSLLLSAHIIVTLFQDMYHFMPQWIARRLKLTGKTRSTSTLGYQVIALALSTIFLAIPLSILTVLVFTKDARATVTRNGVLFECPAIGISDELCSPIIYSKTAYVRRVAEVPWAAVLLDIVGTLVTLIAWCNRSKHIANTPEITSLQSPHVNMVALDSSYEGVDSNAKELVLTP